MTDAFGGINFGGGAPGGGSGDNNNSTLFIDAGSNETACLEDMPCGIQHALAAIKYNVGYLGLITHLVVAEGTYSTSTPMVLDSSILSSEVVVRAADPTKRPVISFANYAPASSSSSARRRLQGGGGLDALLLVAANSPKVTFQNFHFMGAPAAAIRSAGKNVHIEDCVFSNNQGKGAVLMEGGSMQIQSSTFEANSAPLSGGAIGATGGLLHVSDSTFSNNVAPAGSALHVSNQFSRVRVDGSHFFQNRPPYGNASVGAAVQVSDGLLIVANYSRFLSNPSGSLTRAGGTLVYELPAPLGHWLPSAFLCRWYRTPCSATAIATGTCNPDAQPTLPLISQPCNLVEFPEL